ncbi:hypothetical protein C467_07892 [Halorubrum hochstenium ATCC 700873]|uniref:Uncharacterized protein n=1 Tax=Halorubrum hochstenium ATCC 700873 TaxID=1227481 RepID=M0FBQ3_9EURY|nr:hypothetical protein C467_07892 [Halorubrum hochstenium ATCC 700873]
MIRSVDGGFTDSLHLRWFEVALNIWIFPGRSDDVDYLTVISKHDNENRVDSLATAIGVEPLEPVLLWPVVTFCNNDF